MKAKDLIGCLATRVAPCDAHYGQDGSYIGDKLLIINADDDLVAYKHVDGNLKSDEVHILGKAWCDDNWRNLDEFLGQVSTQDEDLKFSVIKNANYSINKDGTYEVVYSYETKGGYNVELTFPHVKIDWNKLQSCVPKNYELLASKSNELFNLTLPE